MADVLKRTLRANVLTLRNELTHYNQEFYDADQTFTESSHQRVVLSTNMASPQEFDLGGVSTGAVMMLKTDRTVDVSLNTTANMLTLAQNGMMMVVGEFTHVYVQNNSTTYQATVELVVTD